MTFLVQQHPSQIKALSTYSRLSEKIALLFKNNAKQLRFGKSSCFYSMIIIITPFQFSGVEILQSLHGS